MRNTNLLRIPFLLAFCLAPAGASDPPHDAARSIACNSCHMTHNAPGGNITAVSGNANLCISCHQSGGTASAKPFSAASQALPSPGLAGANPGGNSHRWDSGPAGHVTFGGGAGTPSTGKVTGGGSYTGVYPKTYTITVTTAGTAATARFGWTATTPPGGSASNVAAGTNVALDQGITVTFTDGTGTSFQLNDKWYVYVRPDLSNPVTAAMQLRTPNGVIMCSTCHDEHSQARQPFDGAAPAYGGAGTGAGRHFQRVDNPTDQMCKDCHTAVNVASSSSGSHPVGVPIPVGNYKAPATLPLDSSSNVECQTCHQVHYGPASDGTLRRVVNTTALCVDCHTNSDTTTPAVHFSASLGVLWPGGQYGTTFPAVADTAKTGYCTNCHRPHGWPDAANPTQHYSKLLVETNDYNLCTTCHDGTPTKNARTDVTTKAYKHPVSAAQQAPGRAVECHDCHNAHKAKGVSHTYTTTATATRNDVTGPLVGVSGITPTFGAMWTTPTYATTSSAAHEYEICLKCHTSNSFGTTPPAGLSPIYSTGTATFTSGSATVTGSTSPATVWVAGMVGAWIRRSSDSTPYRITARASNTSITITPAYAGTTGSAQTYVISQETDVGVEFNPANRSGHPVFTGLDNYTGSTAVSGRKGLLATYLKTPWNTNIGQQTMMCSDCHTTDSATLPHRGRTDRLRSLCCGDQTRGTGLT
jgi:predicted CXXCH cytochrome family protein